MNEENYLKDRVDDQIKWYSDKSSTNKMLYHTCKISEIIIAAVIPFLTGIVDKFPDLKYLIGTLGVIIAILAGLILIFKFQEKWTQYRTTSETLKHEKYLFLTRTGLYQGENPFNLLVERVEFLISKENSNWSQYIIQTNKKSNH
ncbi:MAG: DUF4231 domain-containing protein [Bacteroidales bacterium]